MTNLYIVATPIGNLSDITYRAVEILQTVDMVLCEDTRVTKKLLSHYNIDVPTMSYHANSKLAKTEKILDLLQEGKNLALVSDAGTPTISDPGVQLIDLVKTNLPEIIIVPIPGASAIISALSVAGFAGNEFTFLGFLPHKKGRETLFKEITESKRVMSFYESPHRIMKTLESLVVHLDAERQIVIARELTKLHEQVVRGTAAEVLDYFTQNTDKVRGEFVVIVDGK